MIELILGLVSRFDAVERSRIIQSAEDGFTPDRFALFVVNCLDPNWKFSAVIIIRILIVFIRIVSSVASDSRELILADLGCSIIGGLVLAYIYKFNLYFVIPTLLTVALSIPLLVPEEVFTKLFKFLRLKRDDPVEPLELQPKMASYPMPPQDQTEKAFPIPIFRQPHGHYMYQIPVPPDYPPPAYEHPEN